MNLGEIKAQDQYGSMKSEKSLTQPRVIKDRSSVNSMTSSSSSIVQVSLVECCFGINNVVTANLLPLSLPNNSPHVSRFLAVLRAAMDKNLGKQSRGKVTFFSSPGTGSSTRALGFGLLMRPSSCRGGPVGCGGTVGGAAGAARLGPGGYPAYGEGAP